MVHHRDCEGWFGGGWAPPSLPHTSKSVWLTASFVGNTMLFHAFALVCEQLAATTKKLEKAALLKEYFATLPDDDLALAARFFAGRPFSLADERVLNVGWAIVSEVVCTISGIAREAFGALATRMGEAGA